jgi:hypothetical protein
MDSVSKPAVVGGPIPVATAVTNEQWRLRARQTWGLLTAAALFLALGTLTAIIGPAGESPTRSGYGKAPHGGCALARSAAFG